jgi:ribonuclease-3
MLRRRPNTSLEDALGHRFKKQDLLTLALTHRSYAYETETPEHNERLEFLGDAVLGLVAGEWLYRRHPVQPEGELSKLKSHLVSSRVLAHYGETVGVGEAIRLGVGEERSGGRSKESLLADATEALFGAIYLDAGLDAVRRVIEPMLETGLTETPNTVALDSKTRLQEQAQARGWALPSYHLVAESGPDHQKRFTIECHLEGERWGCGEGGSKKAAERRAAAEALEALERWVEEADGPRLAPPEPIQ